MASGYILLHRSLLENWVWEKGRVFSRAEAWIDLIFLVNFAEGTHRIDNEVLLVPPGSRYTTIKELCERWKWSNTKVTNFLRLLQDDKMIVINHDKKKTLLTLVNWEKYQTKSDKKASEKRRENVEETSLNNKGNKEKINNIYTPEFELWYSGYPRKQAREDSAKNFAKRRKEHGLEFILQCSENYLAYLKTLPPDKQEYTYASNNFFGQKAYYLEYAEPKEEAKRNILQELFGDCEVR